MSAPALRPRSTVEIIDASFQLLRRHYASYVTASVALMLPVVVLRLVLPPLMQWLPQLLSYLLQAVASAAVVLLVSESYLGRDTDVGAALRTVLSRFGSIFAAGAMQGIIVGIGFLLLIVPGFIFLAWTFAMTVVVIVEDRSSSEAFSRSRELARGSGGRILGTLLLAYFVFFFLAMALGGVVGLIAGAVAGSGTALSNVLGDVIVALLYPFVAVVTTLLYYDLRIRKEGFDLEVMAREIGGNAPPSASSVSPA